VRFSRKPEEALYGDYEKNGRRDDGKSSILESKGEVESVDTVKNGKSSCHDFEGSRSVAYQLCLLQEKILALYMRLYGELEAWARDVNESDVILRAT